MLTTDALGEARAAVEQVAAVLHPFPPGWRVLLQLPSGDLLAHFIRACWDRKQVIALAKPSMTQENLQFVIRGFDPHVVVSGRPRLRVELRDDALVSHPPPVRPASVTVFTSGSTGPPKGVVLPRPAIRGNAEKTAALHRITPSRPHATCLDLFHVNALVMSLVGTHLTGSRLVLGSPDEPADYFEAIIRTGARTASVNPVRLRAIVDAALPWPESLDYFITAAGPLSQSLARAFHSCYGSKLRQGYGLSEAVNFSFVMPELHGSEFIDHYIARRPPVGVPLPGTQYVIDDDELLIRTHDRMAGYLGSSAPALVDDSGWLRTGDGAVERDGLVVLCGRMADAIRTTPTTTVLPADLEDRLPLRALLRDAAVAAIRGGRGDADGVALYCDQSWDEDLWDQLAGAFHGLDLLRTDRLAVSPSGKVDRLAMSEEAGRLVDAVRGAAVAAAPALAQGRLPVAAAMALAAGICAGPFLRPEASAWSVRLPTTTIQDEPGLVLGVADDLWLLVSDMNASAGAVAALTAGSFGDRPVLLFLTGPVEGADWQRLMRAWAAVGLRRKSCVVLRDALHPLTVLWGSA